MGETVEPSIIVIGKALRCRWPPERLTQSIRPLQDGAGEASRKPSCASHRDKPFGGPLDLAPFGRPRFWSAQQRLRDLPEVALGLDEPLRQDRKSTRLNSSHLGI